MTRRLATAAKKRAKYVNRTVATADLESKRRAMEPNQQASYSAALSDPNANVVPGVTVQQLVRKLRTWLNKHASALGVQVAQKLPRKVYLGGCIYTYTPGLLVTRVGVGDTVSLTSLDGCQAQLAIAIAAARDAGFPIDNLGFMNAGIRSY
jgi:hypothetical protein